MHSTLLRQLKRCGIDPVSSQTSWKNLLEIISETYQHFDKDITLVNRSLDISSKELTELNNRLQKENESIEKKVEERTNQLFQEQARLQASINSVNVGFVITDNDNTIVSMNSAAKKLIFGQDNNKETYTMADITRCMEKYIDVSSYVSTCKQKAETVGTDEIIYLNRYLKIYFYPINGYTIVFSDFNTKEKKIIGTVMLITDITEDRMLQRSRDEFFSIASHELRTPLTAIMGYTSMILENYSNEINNEEIKMMINNVNIAGKRLISIVNDFLDLSRLELGKIQFKITELDIVSLIATVIDEYRVTSSRKKLYLHFTKPTNSLPRLYADSDRIKQVLINLIGNGLKFTNKGGVTVSVKAEDKYAKILIEDTGIGIPMRNRHLLFRKFQQAGDSIYARDVSKGTGLGLYISKLLIEGMEGEINLESSEEGKGSVFAIRLPFVSS